MRRKSAVRRTERGADDQLRIVLAQEAARLICDHGLTDYLAAKHKAAEKLGLANVRALPNNREIDAAVAEHTRIFRGELQASGLREMREAAMRIMQLLEVFQPRLTGAVLSGNITGHSVIELHLISEPAEEIDRCLTNARISYSSAPHRLKLQRDRPEEFPAYRFRIDGFEVLATVLPERRRMHAPLSPVDGRPMRRARLKELEQLVAADSEADDISLPL
jgi:hypothetical protein